MRRTWMIAAAVALVAAVLLAWAAGNRNQQAADPTTHLATPSRTTAPSIAASSPTTASPTIAAATTAAPSTTDAATTPVASPSYPVTHSAGEPVTADLLADVALAARFTDAMYGRDYTLPHPGFSTELLRTLAIGQARDSADSTIKSAPDRATYTEIQRAGGYWKRVTPIDATVNSDGTIVLVINTLDSAATTTEVNIRATVTNCPAGRCVATWTPFTTQ